MHPHDFMRSNECASLQSLAVDGIEAAALAAAYIEHAGAPELRKLEVRSCGPMNRVLRALVDGGAPNLSHLALRGGIDTADGIVETWAAAVSSGNWERLEVLEMGPVVVVEDAWGRLLQAITQRIAFPSLNTLVLQAEGVSSFTVTLRIIGAASLSGFKRLGLGLRNDRESVDAHDIQLFEEILVSTTATRCITGFSFLNPGGSESLFYAFMRACGQGALPNVIRLTVDDHLTCIGVYDLALLLQKGWGSRLEHLELRMREWTDKAMDPLCSALSRGLCPTLRTLVILYKDEPLSYKNYEGYEVVLGDRARVLKHEVRLLQAVRVAQHLRGVVAGYSMRICFLPSVTHIRAVVSM